MLPASGSVIQSQFRSFIFSICPCEPGCSSQCSYRVISWFQALEIKSEVFRPERRRSISGVVGWWTLALIILLNVISGTVVVGYSLETDRKALLGLKSFLEEKNPVNRGKYSKWNRNSSNPCEWPGIFCNSDYSSVTGIDLSYDDIFGQIYSNFSSFRGLTYLDLSKNTLSGPIPNDLNNCKGLKYLNLSHNILRSELNLSGLVNLEVLDLSVNRFYGEIHGCFPAICGNLIVANISENNFTGTIEDSFGECRNLQHLDLSSNNFTGGLWSGLARLRRFLVSENHLSGGVAPEIFPENCSLEYFEVSENGLSGEFPGNISNCRNLTIMSLLGNNFTGQIPAQIGTISSLKALYLAKNKFSREIPESLLTLSNLIFLDLSNNSFGGDIQAIFGRFTQVKFLLLRGNSYIGGIYTSGILKLPNLTRLDLSSNFFSGPLPEEISKMKSLEFLMLASNQFNGNIPSSYGNLLNLQALDLSFNLLNGSIPSSLGNLKSLLWLMLANNSLTGQIPPELGNCSSLLWLNLANNQLSEKIPAELTNIGKNAMATFEANRVKYNFSPGTGECSTMKRWIPADYPPFSFVYVLFTVKSCLNLWGRLLKGYGLFPVCSGSSSSRILQISGYVQLSGNLLSGELPSEIGRMQNFTMIQLGFNRLSGKFSPEIGRLPLVVLNISQNRFSGEIPPEIGNLHCLQNLDMSYNNFSGNFPTSLNKLNELSKFNISYNPLITGKVPSAGQLSTFEKDSFLGNPLLQLPYFFSTTPPMAPKSRSLDTNHGSPTKVRGVFAAFSLLLAFLVCGVFSIIVCLLMRSQKEELRSVSEDTKCLKDFASSSQCSSSGSSSTVKLFRLDKTTFTHADILRATGNFSEERVVGKGGYGTVYRGVLPDGRQVAVKKLQSGAAEGEREFGAEMMVLSGNDFGWTHPNLVTLYGWCLDGSEKILVYEFMEGGSLEDLVVDRVKLTWHRRIDIAIDVARALVYLHHECFPAVVHRDVKAGNVLLDKNGKARVTDFGLARVVNAGETHVSTMVAGTVGYVAPEYGQTWQATTKGDVYSFGVLAMELATGRRALEGGEECLVEWGKRVMGYRHHKNSQVAVPMALMGSGLVEGMEEMCQLLMIGVRCTAEAPQSRPNMKEVLDMLMKILNYREDSNVNFSPSF